MPTTPASPSARTDAQSRRAQIVEAAFVVIAEKGLEGLRTRDVAARAGLNISTLHYHVGNKQRLVEHVVDRVGELFATALPPLPADPTPLDELRQYFTAQAHRERAHPTLSAVHAETLLRARRDPALREAYTTQHTTWRAHVEATLRRGIDAGLLRADLDAPACAAIVTAFILGSNLQYRLAPSAFDRDAATEALLSTWLKDAVPA